MADFVGKNPSSSDSRRQNLRFRKAVSEFFPGFPSHPHTHIPISTLRWRGLRVCRPGKNKQRYKQYRCRKQKSEAAHGLLR
jgi:hypothetical protein